MQPRERRRRRRRSYRGRNTRRTNHERRRRQRTYLGAGEAGGTDWRRWLVAEEGEGSYGGSGGGCGVGRVGGGIPGAHATGGGGGTRVD
jgi:hypothetical protein